MVVRRGTNNRHRPRDLYPAYAARCRKLWRKQGRHRRDVQSKQIVPLKYRATDVEGDRFSATHAR
jgi:hypothetical protein